MLPSSCLSHLDHSYECSGDPFVVLAMALMIVALVAPQAEKLLADAVKKANSKGFLGGFLSK